MIERYFYLFMIFIIVLALLSQIFAIATGSHSISYPILGALNVINLFVCVCWLDELLEEKK